MPPSANDQDNKALLSYLAKTNTCKYERNKTRVACYPTQVG